MSDHADTIRRLLPLWHVGGTQGDRLREELRALEAENMRIRKLLRDVLPHLEGGHDEARIWAQNVRAELSRGPHV